MPGFDKTGPAGQGPATGRRMGRCRTDSSVQTDEILTGRGRGMGRRLRMGNNQEMPARGKGMGHRFRGGN
ncbi:MAG: DUF5320 domain-containing protein [Draconibacterium sp.]